MLAGGVVIESLLGGVGFSPQASRGLVIESLVELKVLGWLLILV